jgi:hypothetical protein
VVVATDDDIHPMVLGLYREKMPQVLGTISPHAKDRHWDRALPLECRDTLHKVTDMVAAGQSEETEYG